MSWIENNFLIVIAKMVSFLLMSTLSSYAQNQGSIDYRIIDSVVTIKIDKPVINLTVELKNSTKKNLIMYGFRNTFLVGPSGDSLYVFENFKNFAPGNRFFLRADVWPNFGSPHDEVPLDLREKLRLRNVEAMEILDGVSRKEVKLKIDLGDSGPLEKGNYWFYLIYASGDLAKSIVGSNQIEKDMSLNRAIVFNGFIISNRVKLNIE